MPRVVVFLAIGILASFLLAPHQCATYVRTGELVDLAVIENPATGGPMPGPGILPVSQCVSFDERLPLRAAIALGVALGLGLIGWWNRPQRLPFGEYLSRALH